MSAKHPVIAVTGSSGAGTTTTSLAFRKIFAQLNLHAAEVEGDSFHRYTRPEMDMAIRKARDQGKHISYFGPEANDFGLLEQTFVDYGRHGKGQLACAGCGNPHQPRPQSVHGGGLQDRHEVVDFEEVRRREAEEHDQQHEAREREQLLPRGRIEEARFQARRGGRRVAGGKGRNGMRIVGHDR